MDKWLFKRQDGENRAVHFMSTVNYLVVSVCKSQRFKLPAHGAEENTTE